MLYGDVSDVSEPFGACTRGGGDYCDALSGRVSESQADLLVITPNTMVYFARGSKAFQYLGPKVGYSANLYDAEYPYHFYCEAKDQRR